MRVGQLAFGVAFLLTGLSWFLTRAGVGVGNGWPLAVACLAAGAAGLVLAVRAARGAR